MNSGVVTIINYTLESHSCEEQLLQVMNLILEHKPSRFVIDSLTAIQRITPGDEYSQQFRRLTSCLETNEATSIFTAASESTILMTIVNTSTHWAGRFAKYACALYLLIALLTIVRGVRAKETEGNVDDC